MSGVQRAGPVRALVDRVRGDHARHVRQPDVARRGRLAPARAAAPSPPLQPPPRLRAVLLVRMALSRSRGVTALRDGLARPAPYKTQTRAGVVAASLLRAAEGIPEEEDR